VCVNITKPPGRGSEGPYKDCGVVWGWGDGGGACEMRQAPLHVSY
jgi:hypothetical protein